MLGEQALDHFGLHLVLGVGDLDQLPLLDDKLGIGDLQVFEPEALDVGRLVGEREIMQIASGQPARLTSVCDG